MYPKITLTPELAARLKATGNKQQALQTNMKMVTEQWERRQAELLQEGQTTWAEIASKYNIDPRKVNYALEDGVLIPTFVQLV